MFLAYQLLNKSLSYNRKQSFINKWCCLCHLTIWILQRSEAIKTCQEGNYILEFVLVLILFLLSYYQKLLQFLGMIWCLKKDFHTTNYSNKLAENWKISIAENTAVSYAKFKLQAQAQTHFLSQSVLSSIFPRNWSSIIKKR